MQQTNEQILQKLGEIEQRFTNLEADVKALDAAQKARDDLQKVRDRPPAKAWGLLQKLRRSICGFQKRTGCFNGVAYYLAKQNNRSYNS